MNIRKPIDYSTMFATLDTAIAAELPQVELYHRIGAAICERIEKGAAVAASEYLAEKYPDTTGFSPRNVRRMRDFYRMYDSTPDLLTEALMLNWTQNVVIMEAELSMEERHWYIRKVAESRLSKVELLRMIQSSAHLEISLDEIARNWYTEEKDECSEREQYEEDPVYLSRQYLSQPDGRVRDEELGEEGWCGITIPYRIGSHQPGGDRQSGPSPGAAQAGGARDLLRRSRRAAAYQSGLRQVRPADRHGQRQPPGYVPHLRRRLCRQDVPPDGPYYPPRQCGRPVVHRGLRGNLAGCVGGVPGLAERIIAGAR